MKTYVALLRGVNVGGKAMIKMADLATALSNAGLTAVRTYIQSGNILFQSDKSATAAADLISQTIKQHFDLDVIVAVFSEVQWQKVIDDAPSWWGKNSDWKHNLLVMIQPFSMSEVVAAIGELKPDIEAMQPGDGVLYQSMSLKLYGRTTTGKLASSPVYKQMTIRNYNTATKLLALLKNT